VHGKDGTTRAVTSFASVIVQIMLLDVVFSLDSVITAVGMVDQLGVMIAAVIAAVLVMLFASGPISRFVDKHPSIKMLALSFLVLIGVVLIAEGLGQHISKGYIYFAMAFSVIVELLNIRMRSRHAKQAS
jgi:predicted tellurium resistance membrane protein TerC